MKTDKLDFYHIYNKIKILLENLATQWNVEVYSAS